MPVSWYCVEPPADGSIMATLKKTTAVFSGQVPTYGPLAGSLKKVNGTFAGSHPYTGDLVGMTKKAQANFVGAQTILAAFAASTKKVTSNFDQSSNVGAIAGSTRKTTGAFAGAQDLNGLLAGSTKKVVSGFTAQQENIGALVSDLRKAQAQFTGQQDQSGSMAGQTNKIVGLFTGNTVIPQIDVNSVGTLGASTVGGGTMSCTVPITIVAGDANRRAYAVVGWSHSNWLRSWTVSASTSLGPTNFTLISGPLGLGDSSGWRQGGIAILELINPPAGAQTVTLTVSSTQGMNYIHGNVIVFNNVGGRTTPVQISNPPKLTTPILNLPAAGVGDMHFATIISNAAMVLTGNWPAAAPARWINNVQNVDGDGDDLYAGYLAGDGSAKTFTTSSGSPRYAGIGLNLTKAV